MRWYVRRGEREIGPLGEDGLRALVGTGQITPDSQLWREGLSGWTPALALPGVLGPRASAPFAADSRSAVVAAPTPRVPATPWRRYWARSIDITISTVVVDVLIGALRPTLLGQLTAAAHGRWVVVLILLPFALIMDAVIHWALGNTPGKAIAGSKVLAEGGGRPLSAAAYLGRNFGMYVFGLGLGVPLVSLITLIVSYRHAAAGEISRWDRFSGSRVYALSGAPRRTWVAVGAYFLVLLALIALRLHTQHDKSTYIAARAPAPILKQELTEAANSVNAMAPRMIDGITRLDGAHAGPGSLFTYEYTLTNMRVARLSAVSLETLRWRLSAHVRQAVCRGTALQPMLRIGTTVRFHYRDQDGQEVATVAVSSADCAG
jgi:HAMP domain-containing protein